MSPLHLTDALLPTLYFFLTFRVFLLRLLPLLPLGHRLVAGFGVGKVERLRLEEIVAVCLDVGEAVVLGVESVPDGLAAGLLANVNPLAGLYGYLYGTIGGALFTATPFMTVPEVASTQPPQPDVN